MSVYLYGVTRKGVRVPHGTRGVGNPPGRVRTLVDGDLAAVVGTAPEGLRARRRDLRAHQGVLLAVGAGGPLLPMRFGAVVADEDAVTGWLRGDAGGWAAALDRVAGRCELNLKVSPAEHGLADLVRDDPRLRQLREESRRRPSYDVSIRLGEAVVAGLRRRAVEAAQAAAAPLTALADETQPGPDVPGCVLNLSFLVAADRVPECRAAFDGVAERLAGRADLRLTGPLPCYSFSGLPAPAGI
ncbi:GvpL/GvpF family gas vesicle protein [Streptomyces sp. NRRL F-5123]|uniref:GvpL/GvpF family gas vesicle protein n=1 Tax=Streptomyces sp. NRRL F-5123 TaxID=1463856 RepID=UPI0004E1FDB4|nr:GvpL/GvpF family gas vesicle protein [Streptomyces sp. NRRL F-5123]